MSGFEAVALLELCVLPGSIHGIAQICAAQGFVLFPLEIIIIGKQEKYANSL